MHPESNLSRTKLKIAMQTNIHPQDGLFLSTISSFIICIAFSVAAATTESNLNKSFSAKPGGQLVVDVDQGSIEIKTAERANVAIEVKRKITGVEAAKAQEIF